MSSLDSNRPHHRAGDDRIVEVDFLIVGGGIQGVTLLHQFAAAGARRVLLVTRDELGVGETLHSHGYMHHGYMLPAANQGLAGELAECAAWWWRRIEALGSAYSSQPPVYYCVSAAAAAERLAIWNGFGADYTPLAQPPEALLGGSATDGSTRLFSIRDRTVSMPEIVADLAASVQDRIVRAELTAIGLDDSGTRVADCRFARGADAAPFVVRPRVLLLANGRFAQPLLREARTRTGERPLRERCREFHNIRFVPMLLVRGRHLPSVTGYFESHATFLCTHPVIGGAGDESMWIVTYLQGHETDRGDFDDARETVHRQALREGTDRLCALVPAARQRRREDLRFSGYMGGKIDHPDGGNARHIDDCGLANLRVAWPGLWSLALANARDLVAGFRADAPCPGAFDPGARPIDLHGFGLPTGVRVGEERRLTAAQPWLSAAEFERALDAS